MGNFNNTVGSVSLQSGSITGTGGTLASTTTFGVESGTVSANLGGSVGLTKTTGSTVTLSGANTYTGATIVSAGTLQVNSTLASTTYTLDGGSLVIGASNFLPNNSAVLLTGGTLVMGNFNNTVGSVTLLTGSITGTGGTLTSTTDFDMQSGTVSAILGGGGGLRKSTSSTVTLSAANTYTGVTSVVAGTLQVNNTLASASYSLDFGGLVIGASNLLPNNSAVNLTGGTLALGNFNNTVGSVRLGSGSITGTGGTLTSTTDFELWNGSVSAILSGGVGLSKSVGTTVTLSAANSYSGNTTVSQGILALSGSGSFASSPTIAVGYGTKLDVKGVTGGANHDGTHFALVSGQTLHGNGIVIGAMDVGAGATIAPGDSIGTLGVSDLSLTSATAVVKLEIDFGVTPDADLLDVTGGITLANSTLDLSLLNLSPTSVPETFLVVANDLSDAVTETFGTITGVPNGYIATVDYAFTGADALGRIGDGNDIAVTVNQIVPEPSTWTMLGLGLPALLGLRRFRR